MNILTITNLCPRPDQPTRGLFNAQFFAALHVESGVEVKSVCLVPEWRVWRWKEIRAWNVDSTVFVPVFYIPLVGRNFSDLMYGLALRNVKDLAGWADVILATWLYPDCVAASRLAKENGTPIWFKAHGSDVMHLKNAVRRRKILEACEYASGIICVSNRLSETFRDVGVDEKKTHVLSNGVDTDKFYYRPKEVAIEDLKSRGRSFASIVGTKKKVVLFVGNLVHVKGPDLLVEAWDRYVCDEKAGADSMLVMIGDGDMSGKLGWMVRRMGIEDSVIFTGRLSHEEIALWMNLADCLCVPSRSEGMPNVVLEAVASGLPVITFDVGGCADVVFGREDCCVLDVSNRHEDNVSKLSEALKLFDKIERKGAGSGDVNMFSWGDSAREMLKLMRRNGNPPPAG